jgi:ribonuclease HI
MKDPWIRGGDNWWVESPQREEAYDMTVDQLMLDGERKWDAIKINNLFSTVTANNILSMKLFQEVREDKFIWEGEKDGKYTVRAGYRSIMSEAWKQVGSAVNRNWSAIWDINTSPKTRHLVWRVCRGCIPTRNLLLQRHVVCEEQCPFCNDEAETEFHIFFTCPRVRLSWEAAGLMNVLIHKLHVFNNAADLLFNICSSEDSNNAGRVATLLWYIWQSRNDIVWNNNQPSMTQIGLNAFNAWQVWFEANNVQSSSQQQAQNVTNTCWNKPSQGWIKINVDAAFFRDQGMTSVACCVRDETGSFICAKTRTFNTVVTVLEGEALALLEAIRLAVHHGWDHVAFESDSNTLVHSIAANNTGNSEFSDIVSSIKNMLSLLSNFEVKFVRRQANMVAHALARAAISWASHRFFDIVPPCIERLMNNEIC